MVGLEQIIVERYEVQIYPGYGQVEISEFSNFDSAEAAFEIACDRGMRCKLVAVVCE